MRLRVGRWPGRGADAGRGTVLLFPGRTEYIEKYGRTARDLTGAGWDVLAVDWRGQGLSDRLAGDPVLGHVELFSDYQRDVAAVVAHAGEADLPKPWTLLAHSMGGCIGLAALHEGLAVERAVFSAPMWGIGIAPRVRPFAWTLAWIAKHAGQSLSYTPGRGPANAELVMFDGNPLTTDEATFHWLTAQVEAHPELALGGPSLGWLREALRETRRLRALPPPAVPALIGLGGEERIVDGRAIERLAARWHRGSLHDYPGARHELLMERPEVRDAFVRESLEFLARL